MTLQAQQKEWRQVFFPNRPLLMCPLCKKLGYEYVKTSHGHTYAYTIHYNEPPVGKFLDSRTKYRECSKGGRLFDSIEDAFKGEDQKKKRKQRDKIIPDCPKCHKKGRLQDYNDRGIIKQVVIHEKIKGEFWGRKNKVQARERCWLGRKTIN